ncbi:MAG: histidine phosphatase family protein [Hungatella sp.]
MKIYLIRHGRQCSKLCNVNVDLCEAGYLQAVLLGKRLAGAKIDALYSSDLLRAVETAQEANKIWKVPHTIYPELREISFGEMEGFSDEVLAVQFADFKRQQEQMTADLPYPGGENAADVVARALPVLRRIAESGCKRAAVVTHGGVIRSLTAKLIGMDLAKMKLIGTGLENCSITELDYHAETGRFTLERFNDYAHLEENPELLRSSWVSTEN